MMNEFVTQRRTTEFEVAFPELCAALNLSLSLSLLFILLSEINQPLSSKSDDLVVVLFEREREREREKTRVFSICICVFSLF